MKAGTDSQRWFADPTLQRLLDQHTRSTVTPGNAVRLLINGDSAFARRHENLATAKVILVKTFIWTDDEAGRRLADDIAARARAGVPVVIQYDYKGNIGSLADAEDMLSRATPERPVGEPRVIADLRAAGAIIVATNSPGRPVAVREWADNSKRLFNDPNAAVKRSMESLLLFDHCDHDKYFITIHDGGEVRAIVGGLNIASEYALGGVPTRRDPKTGRGGWRDTDLEISGPSAFAIIDEFLADYQRHRGAPPPAPLVAILRELSGDPTIARGDVAIRFVVNNPLFDKTRHIEDVYRILVMATPKTEPIYLATPYFAPSKELRDALLAHMRAGGSVTVVTNSYDSSDIGILTDAARYSARELFKSERFRYYERIPRPDIGEVMLHHKVASFGKSGPVIIGSPNLDAQSFVHNGEALAVIENAVFRKLFDQMAAVDIAGDRARAIGRADLESVSLAARLRSFVAGELAWYWL